MLDVRILFRMMIDGAYDVETQRITCLDIEVDLSTDCAKDKDDVEVAPKELLDLIDRYERRSQPNIDLPLEVNLGTESEPRVVFVGTKLERELKNQLIT